MVYRAGYLKFLTIMEKYDKALRPATVLYGGKNSYRIDRVLGQGTFGITYLAYTTATVEGPLGKLQTEMQVAVKEFFMGDINGREGSSVTTGGSGELFDRYRRKFAREAANLAKLKHRCIVKVIETFDANGTSYYAMEYCGGGSLDARIMAAGGLPQEEALRYFGQIAEALQYMHRRRMLHLDLKPGNVMLRTSGEAVLIDFGLSKQFDADGEPESSTTIGGGTPGYASIEQANYNEDDSGGKLPVTMDIYALGGTLYKMLIGKRPPVASDVLARFPGILEKPLYERGVSDDVVAAICRAMQPIPDNRYQSVVEFAASIGEGTVPVPPPEPEPRPDVILIDDGEQHEEKRPEQNEQNVEQNNREKATPPIDNAMPERPRSKWLPWVVGVAVAAVAFVALMSLQRDDNTQPAIEIPEDLLTAVTQGDTVAAEEQPVQHVVQQPQPTKPELQQAQQQQLVQQELTPQQQQPVEQQQPEPEPEPTPAPQPQRPQHNLPEIAMVYVSGGTFTMGATSEQGSDAYDWEKPAHSVTLDGYYIGKYEVTQKLWKAVMGSNPSGFKGDSLPVESVSWNDVQEFLCKLNDITGMQYRLPTEAEWEFAARGGNSSCGYKYSGSNSHDSVAWHYGNSGGRTHAVGTKFPNELGIYDMSGNVWEWCQDWYGEYSGSTQRNPKGPNRGTERVYRGGAWTGMYVRVSFRLSGAQDSRYSSLDHCRPTLGFRLAL